MQPFFEFLGNYWWLVFPLMGVMGGIGSAWERGARRRHRRRLEVLHAKAELKAAQAAARGKTGPIAVAADGSDLAHGRPVLDVPAELERLFADHDATTARWLEYELDVAKLIAFPAMSDGRQPLTAAFLRAKRVADGLRPASAKARITPEQLDRYRAAVTDFEVAFDVAERDARRLKDSSFTEAERKRLDTAKQLLTVAIDQAATPAERQLAYRRVREELDGLISLSDEAFEVLEKKVLLELPSAMNASTTAKTDAAAPPAASTTAAERGAEPAPPTGPSAPAPEPEPLRAPLPNPGSPSQGIWPVPSRSDGPRAPKS